MSLYITRQPLINRQGKIIATRLRLHSQDDDSAAVIDALNGLVDCWPQSDRSIFVNFDSIPGDMGLLDWVAPANVTFELPGAPFCAEQAADFVAALKEARLSLCYDFDASAAQALNSGTGFRFIGFDLAKFSPAQLKVLAAKTQAFGIPVVFNVDSQQGFKDCIEAGMSAAAGWFVKQPSESPAKQLNASQAHIVRVLNLVRKNADVGEIEAALKQDVALSYKLLRYINSVGFGLSCEVQSFKHAVTILGYEKLNKWLSLLLVTASKDPMAPTLMHTALTRGRMMEQLGQGLVDRQEYDNLFITGAFSMLDLLLGVSMENALEAMHLPEPITDALLGNGGLYAPFLELALACEGGDGAALAAQAELLGLRPEQVNRAQLAAINFADTMEY
ncbi:EAL and HDOD domain-containing protein [Azospira restricta]|uniref:HDOD domain-containing protein n=1 Tax=Azospira restricta TaxID=404405 RepID=A0A974Y470_9RHOO|nr:HDOD domain-containing protein [Azospira restricta]QRJ64221.1 HDOD domain-containing protein [Azospira restricta]